MKCSTLMLGALALVLSVGNARAQEAPHSAAVKFGVMGGVSIPLSPLSDSYNLGFNGGALLDFHLPNIPVGLRVDGMYHQFGAKSDVAVSGAKTKLIGGDLNAVFSIPTSSAVSPYVTGGIGLYNVKFSSDAGDASETKFAFNAGAGLRADISGFGAFVEARFLDVFTSGSSLKTIPIDIGIMFGKF